MIDQPNDSTVPAAPEAAPPPGRFRAKLQALFAVDLRSLALLRIGLGISVLADVAVRSFDFVGLYTDGGVLPRDLLRAMEGPGVYLSAHYWASAHPLAQAALFAVTAVFATALLVGWRSRLATLACWYLVASLQIRQPLVYMGGDSILRMLLFWGLFLPLGARFSVDAAKGRTTLRPERFLSGATVALLLQVCLIYWVTGIRKRGGLWWSGQAVFYALHSDQWATPLGIWLRDYPAILEALTYGTLGLELFGPFLAFVPVWTPTFRLVTVAIFWLFHTGLASTMNIGLFPLFSMVAWLPFIPTQAWTRWTGTASPSRSSAPARGSRLLSIAASVCLCYVIVLLAERSRLIPRMLPPQAIAAGTMLRIQQAWSMFAPDPPTMTRQHEIRWTLRDGSLITEPASTSFRWTVYLGRAAAPFSPANPLTQSALRFAEHRCASRKDIDPRIERIAIVIHDRRISPAGQGESTTRVVVDAPCSSTSGPVRSSRSRTSARARSRAAS